MRKHDRLVAAVLEYLRMLSPSIWRKMCSKAQDERKRKGREWSQHEYLANCVLGKLAGVASLRTLEMLTEFGAGLEGGTLGGRRMPDSNVHDWMVQASQEAWHQRLTGMANDLHRRKMLEPERGVQIGKVMAQVVVFDGKVSFSKKKLSKSDSTTLWRKKHTKTKVKMADGSTKEVKQAYYTADIVRAVLASAPAPVCLALAPFEKGDEVKTVRKLRTRLVREMGWLSTRPLVVMGDARQGNTQFAKDMGDPYPRHEGEKPSGQFYLLKIKGNAGDIYTEGTRAAKALLDAGASPEATDDWHSEGHGRRVKRELFRVDTPFGLSVEPEDECRMERTDVAILSRKAWPTVRQIIVVRQSQHLDHPPKDGSPQDTQELRLLIANIKQEDCSARDLLTLVRMEWQVEVHHNVLDLVMREDDRLWASAGNSPLAMASVNSMAANLLLLLRHRHLRSDDSRELSYPQLQMLILGALAGQRAFKVLQAQQKAALLGKLSVSDSQRQLPEEFTRQWSDADVSLLMAGLRQLFTYVAAAAAGAVNKVTLLLTADLQSGDIAMDMNLI